jgi:hypothetical protein
MFGHDTGTALVNLKDNIEVFQTLDGLSYASVKCRDRIEIHRLPSKALECLVRSELQQEGILLPSQAQLQIFLKTLEAEAQTSCRVELVHNRVGRERGKVFLDLGTPDGECVQVDRDGWIIQTEAPVFFSRSRGTLELPTPVKGGSIDILRRFLNVGDPEFVLIVGWLLAVLGGRGPYPVLAITGEAGSAKSTAARILRMLVDPHTADLSCPPKSENDLAFAAIIGRVVVLDNVSAMPRKLSDAICRLSTGHAFTLRRGQSVHEHVTFAVEAPVILNGIGNLTPSPDLADRTITIDLDSIPENMRKPRHILDAEFERARPAILGALLDAVAEGLRNETASVSNLSRMADFEHWVCACETAFAPAGTFSKAYRENQSNSAVDALDAEPVARGFVEFLKTTSDFEGTHQDLLRQLTAFLPTPPGARFWPSTPRALSSILRRAAPNLRKAGVTMDHLRQSGGNRERIIRANIAGPRVTPPLPADPGPVGPKRARKAPKIEQPTFFRDGENSDLAIVFAPSVTVEPIGAAGGAGIS